MALRVYPISCTFSHKLIKFDRKFTCLFSSSLPRTSTNATNICSLAKPIEHDKMSGISLENESSLSGLEEIMMGYIFGKSRATEVAHSVWKRVVQKGDTLVDATCGNGNDTLAMLKMVADKSHRGRVYAMDVQKIALENTMCLLDKSFNQEEKELVELFAVCHSKMEEVVPKHISVRLVAFNLGYLPGGDKSVITSSETTLLGLEAAERILTPGGVISLVVYVGHPGGREEFETVQGFAAGLPVDKWVCCKLQMLNRPLAPVLVFLFKR